MSHGVFVTNEQVRLTGSLEAALFLAQCLYWSSLEMVEDRDGWFYKSRDEWSSEIHLSRYKQEKARQVLRSLGLLEERQERSNVGIRLWYRLDKAVYHRLLNSQSKTLDGDTRLSLSYDNGHWIYALKYLNERCEALYPHANPELVVDAIEGHLEYWAYRSKGKPSKTAKELSGLLLSREGEYLSALNDIGQKVRTEDLEDFTTVCDERTKEIEPVGGLTDCSESSVDIDIYSDRYIDNTIVPIYAYKAKNGTIDQDNISSNNEISRDIYSDKPKDIQSIPSVEDKRGVDKPVGLSTPAFSDRPNKNYSTDPEDYLGCHPYIHGFIQFFNDMKNDEIRDDILGLVNQHGFGDETTLGSLNIFMKSPFGQAIRARHELFNPGLPFPDLTDEDIDDAIEASKGEWL